LPPVAKLPHFLTADLYKKIFNVNRKFFLNVQYTARIWRDISKLRVLKKSFLLSLRNS